MEVFYLSTNGSAQITYTQSLISLVYDTSMPTNLNTSIKKNRLNKKIDFFNFCHSRGREEGPNGYFFMLVSIYI